MDLDELQLLEEDLMLRIQVSKYLEKGLTDKKKSNFFMFLELFSRYHQCVEPEQFADDLRVGFENDVFMPDDPSFMEMWKFFTYSPLEFILKLESEEKIWLVDAVFDRALKWI